MKKINQFKFSRSDSIMLLTPDTWSHLLQFTSIGTIKDTRKIYIEFKVPSGNQILPSSIIDLKKNKLTVIVKECDQTLFLNILYENIRHVFCIFVSSFNTKIIAIYCLSITKPLHMFVIPFDKHGKIWV